MSDWCYSKFFVTGKKESVLKFKKHAQTKTDDNKKIVLDANRFIPYPEKYRKMDEAARRYKEKHGRKSTQTNGFNSGGYEWCLDNWGTKWGIFHALIDNEHKNKDKLCLEYSFITANSPCIPVVKKMAQMFPDLNFVYKFECDFMFEGTLVIKKGRVVSEQFS